MLIELAGDTVRLSSSDATVLINPVATATNIDTSAANILLGDFKKISGYNIIEPGEYELFNVNVTALELKPEKIGIADFFQVEIDGVAVTIQQDAAAEIEKNEWDILVDTHVLVVNAPNADQKIDKLINKHNPHKLISINTTAEEAAKSTSMPVKEQGKKFKFTDKDFTSEEYTTEHYLLQ
jgi:hypothetical protein